MSAVQNYIDQGYKYFAFDFDGKFLEAYRYHPKHEMVTTPFPPFFGMVYWQPGFSESTLYETEGNLIQKSKAPPIYLKGELDALDHKIYQTHSKRLK